MDKEDTFILENYLCDSLILGNSGHPTRQISSTNTPRADKYESILKGDPWSLLTDDCVWKPRHDSENNIETPIQQFFHGKHIFITGGTGFVGKVLTEKLLRSIPQIGDIYILIRAKRGKSFKERFENLMNDMLFQRLEAELPEYRNKVTPVEGDISEPGLGLSAEDRRLLTDRVHVVFHSAANVGFIEPLRVAIDSNVLGSQKVVELAKDMKNLECLVYVSTAYSQCASRNIKESVPKMYMNYKYIIKYVYSSTDAKLEEDQIWIKQGWPNTYCFSKAVCEDMLQEECKGLPLCIHRPSIVYPTYKEPVRGWTDNINGHNGVFLGTVLGVIHCFLLRKDVTLDIVPVDYVVNCLIAAAWNTSFNKVLSPVPVYNFTFTPVKSVRWKHIINYLEPVKSTWPFSEAIWYPSFIAIERPVLDDICHFFLHKVPGVMFDKLLAIQGKKPRLSRAYEKMLTLKPYLHFFIHNTWVFENENVIKLWQRVSEEDKKLFNFDLSDVDVKEHIFMMKLGARYYLLKEKMENMPAAERKNRWLYAAHILVKMFTGMVILKLLVCVARVIPI